MDFVDKGPLEIDAEIAARRGKPSHDRSSERARARPKLDDSDGASKIEARDHPTRERLGAWRDGTHGLRVAEKAGEMPQVVADAGPPAGSRRCHGRVGAPPYRIAASNRSMARGDPCRGVM